MKMQARNDENRGIVPAFLSVCIHFTLHIPKDPKKLFWRCGMGFLMLSNIMLEHEACLLDFIDTLVYHDDEEVFIRPKLLQTVLSFDGLISECVFDLVVAHYSFN